MKKKERLTAYQYLLKDKLSGDKNRELIALLKDIKLAGRQVAKELNVQKVLMKNLIFLITKYQGILNI